MYNYHNRKKLILSIYLILFLFIGIGYAYLTSNLSIAGNTTVATNTWNIHFEDLNVTEGSVTATTEASINGSANAITYAADLSRPGDFYEFTVDVKNSGTLPGKVAIASISGIPIEAEPIIDYKISYMNDADITTNDILNEGATKTIKVRVFYKTGIDPEDFPDEDLNLTLTFTLQYVQSDHSLPTGTLKGGGGDTSKAYGYSIGKYLFESVEFLDYIDIPNDAIASWDASEEQNNSIKAWYLDEDNNGKYELYIGSEGGVYAPEDSSWEVGYFSGAHTINVSKLNVSRVENMFRMFFNDGLLNQTSPTFKIIGLDKWDTSNVLSMNDMFMYTGGSNNTENYYIDVSKFNTSNVTRMDFMFEEAGSYANHWEIGNLSNWDLEEVNNTKNMFDRAANSSTEPINIGTINLYSTDIGSMFFKSTSISATINLYNNPTRYGSVFSEASTLSGSGITVNYTSSVTNIDDIIATKSSNSNIIKGSLIE